MFEAVVRHAEHDVTVHLDESPVAVEGETLVRHLREPDDRVVVEPEIEHRIHHAGHRCAGAGSDGDQQRTLGIPEAEIHQLLDVGQCREDVGLDRRGKPLTAPIEVRADIRRDRESRRYRDPERRHLRQVRALAAEDLLHPRMAIGASAPEEEHPPLTRRLVRSGRARLARLSRRALRGLTRRLAGGGLFRNALLRGLLLVRGLLPGRCLLACRPLGRRLLAGRLAASRLACLRGGSLPSAHSPSSRRSRRACASPSIGTRS